MAKKGKKVINFLDLVHDNEPDFDNDGLSDKEERRLGTNPYVKDSDSDGLSDFEETQIYGTDPLDTDTDKDGMSDGDEVRVGRNPRGPGLLNDLFIPHEGNNYHPQALLHGRLAFHAVSAIAVKLVLFFFLVFYPMEAWLTPDISAANGQKILSLTNELRHDKGVSELKANPKLEQSSLAKAQDMLVGQYFDHINPQGKKISDWLSSAGYKYSVAGENLAMGFSDPEMIIEAWKKSPTHYSNLIDPDFKEIGVGVVDGRYGDQETMLAVEHFGSPSEIVTNSKKTITTLPKTKTIVPKNIVTKNSSPTITKKKSTQELGQPKLSFPPDGYLSKETNVNLRIAAQAFDKISVYVDGDIVEEKIGSSKEPSMLVPVVLSEGKHEIFLAGFKGNDKVYSAPSNITIDRQAPIAEKEKTEILIGKLNNNNRIIEATAYLSPDTKKAELVLSDYHFDLYPEGNDSNKWVGRGVFFSRDEDKIFNPVVMASVVATDRAGTTAISDIGWKNIKPIDISVWDQYFFLKKYQPKGAQMLLNLANKYFLFILSIALLALILNIFVAIKRQHPRVIVSSLSLIGILIILIVI